MQVLQAGVDKYILLELEAEALGGIASQAGFELHLEETKRAWIVDLTAQERQAPLLLFDAADPGNLGWFSRCQWYAGYRFSVAPSQEVACSRSRRP